MVVYNGRIARTKVLLYTTAGDTDVCGIAVTRRLHNLESVGAKWCTEVTTVVPPHFPPTDGHSTSAAHISAVP